MLDEVPVTGSALAYVCEQLPYDVQLMVAREDLQLTLAAGGLVLFLDNLSIVLEDVGEATPRQKFAPEVVGLQPIRVRRVAGAVVPALVEGQEEGVLPLELREHHHLLVIDRQVHDAALELEQKLSGVSVAAVLLNRVVHSLLRQVVLQLEGCDGQAVYEQAQVQGEHRLVPAILKLPRNAEDVLVEQLPGLSIARRRSSVEEIDRRRPVLDPLSQNIDHAPLRDLTLKPSEELLAARPLLLYAEQPERLRPGRT